MAIVDRVDAIRLGGWRWAPGYEIFWMDMTAPDAPLALIGLVIRAADHVVLVNCGPDPASLPPKPDIDPFISKQHVLEVDQGEALDEALAAAGTTVDDITHVIVTPFQTYALGNILRFPNAQLCLSRKGWIDFHAPRWRSHPHDKRSSCIPDNVLIGLVTDAWPRVRLVEDEEIVPGVETFWTGVHHRASLAVKIRTRVGTVIAGDAFMRVDNIARRHPIGINESMEEALVAYDRIAREADILIPLYDPAVFERHPGGRIA